MKKQALLLLFCCGTALHAAPQTYNFTVRATDADGDYDEKAFSLTVLDAVSPDGFTTWVAQIPDAEQRGPSDDYDKDGLPNLLEYAFGLNPLAADAEANGAELSLSSKRLQLRFLRDPDKTDIIYRVEASTDLSDWSEILYTSLTPQSPYLTNNDGDHMVVSDSEDVDTNPGARFLRLVVETAVE